MGGDDTKEAVPLLPSRTKSGMAALEVKVSRGSSREPRTDAGEARH